MGKKLSLSVLLGLREKLEKNFKNLIDDMLQKFTKKQGIFGGYHNTYEAVDSFADDDTKRGFQNVESTVENQLAWMNKYSEDYLNTVFSIEKTNAQNILSKLWVNGEDWGEYTTLELLRLKGILTGKLHAVIKELPIRSHKFIWTESTAPEFTGRKIWETPKETGFSKTTIKDTVIVNDPHIAAGNRPPVTKEVTTQVNVGKYTKQTFTGAITNLERAQMEVRIDDILRGVIEALEVANSIEVSTSDLGDKVRGYLFK